MPVRLELLKALAAEARPVVLGGLLLAVSVKAQAQMLGQLGEAEPDGRLLQVQVVEVVLGRLLVVSQHQLLGVEEAGVGRFRHKVVRGVALC
jgi:hypothetical protein